jgi:hypothetical protein
MSLINDALKRAKATHQQSARPSPMQDVPALVTTPSSHPSSPAWLWVAIIVLLVGLGAFLIGQSMRNSGNINSLGSDAANVATKQPISTTTRTASTISENPTPVPVEAPSAQVAPAAIPVSSNATVIASVQTDSTDVAAVVAAPAPPPPMKLQSIIYDPQHPSAMINGKLLFPGDSFGELHVQEIHRNGVTLSGGGKTNLLSLDY